MGAISLLFLQSLLVLVVGTSSPQGLILLTTSSCICPGHQLVYECTVVGQAIQYTVWKGSALDCGSGISLRHGRFIDTGYANGTCNSGAVFARITNNTGGRYVSQLIVNASLNFNNKSIQCFFDDGANEMLVNTSIIRIITGSFPPPNNVRLIDVQPGQVTFNWTSVDTECDSLSYNIISYNCGMCPPTTSNTSVTCINVVALGQLCTFLVQTVVCGNTGNLSRPTTVVLKAPRIQIIQSIPQYDYKTESLLSIASSFESLVSVPTHWNEKSFPYISRIKSTYVYNDYLFGMQEPIIISDGFTNDILSYSVQYSDLSSMNICSQKTTIPVSVCQNGLCKHLFHVATSLCNSMTNITVTVTTTSLLGPHTSDPITIDSRNRLFRVETVFSTNIIRISCSFLNLTPVINKRSCTVMFGLEQDRSCDVSMRNEHTVRANRSHVSVDLPITFFPTESVSETICYVVIASDDTHTAEAKGMLTVTAGCDASQLSDGAMLSSAINCGSPMFTASIKDGLVCYTGTHIGATAMYHCFDCGSSSSARTCLPNGTWNGTVPQCNCDSQSPRTIASGRSIIHAAIPMGVVIILVSGALIIVTIFLVKSRLKVQKLLREKKAKEEMQIYEDINLSEIIDSMKNVAYETPSQTQIHCSHS